MIININSILQNNEYLFFQKRISKLVYSGRCKLRNLRYYIRNYQISLDKKVEGNTIFFIIDARTKHPGLADRLKAAVHIFYIASVNNFHFKLIFNHPFLLSDFLEENEINWNATYNDLSFSVKNSRILSYNGEGKIPKLDKKVKQYHVYTYNHESILKSNNIPNFYILWGKLFNSLFKPSMRLVIEIKNTKFEKGKYIAVHFRFVNALDSFEEGYYNSLSKSYSEKLINRCLKILFQLKQEFDGKEILVFSDSQRFVRITQEKGFPTLSGKIGHISFLGDDLNVVLKTFVDFYMIAGAYQVYRAYSPEMYKSGFSYYAALVGGKEAIECSIP